MDSREMLIKDLLKTTIEDELKIIRLKRLLIHFAFVVGFFFGTSTLLVVFMLWG